jgi:hypothetical protein
VPGCRALPDLLLQRGLRGREALRPGAELRLRRFHWVLPRLRVNTDGGLLFQLFVHKVE